MRDVGYSNNSKTEKFDSSQNIILRKELVNMNCRGNNDSSFIDTAFK